MENTSLGSKKVYWYIENSFVGNDEQIKYEFMAFDETTADTFQVILIAESNDACFDTLTKYLPFKYETIFYIPTGFTPNGDGLNDVFYIEGEGIKTEGFEFSIFDRWGKELFRTEDPKSGWNGIQNNGEYFQQGAYSYVLKYIDRDNEPKAIRGEITISRSGPKKGL